MIRDIERFEAFDFQATGTDPTPGYPQPDWEAIYSLMTTAFTQDLVFDNGTRKPAEVSEYLGDFDDFKRTHIDPMVLVEEGRLNPQRLARPMVTMATERSSGKLVGVAFSADAISGRTPTERVVKSLLLPKRHLWVEQVAVHPQYQRIGLGTVLLYAALRQALPGQPGSAYTYPQESSAGSALLRGVMHRVDQPLLAVDAFGEDRRPARQARFVTPATAQNAAATIARSSGYPDFFRNVRDATHWWRGNMPHQREHVDS